ncbi:MAG: hypothetical protein GY800_00660 [Planctomycetes bacterium]|nr:hypothetical protein [Planctomycetota bacterium]
MTVDQAILSVLGTADFAQYEQDVYKNHQEIAEKEIITQLNELLSSPIFLMILKQWGTQCACRFIGFREITVRLKSGKQWEVLSPAFLRAKPKRKSGMSQKRQKGALRHLGLELLGIIKQVSPALIETCVSMAVLCPSFEVAANALRGLGISMNEHLLQNITQRFAGLAKSVRVECNGDDTWQKPGLRILICVDGGRVRERCAKRGRRKKGLKRQGYTTDWFEPRLLIISQFDEEGKKRKSVSPILDGSCGSLDDFFELLKQYLLSINLEEASEIVFCADGGNGIWPRTEMLIRELELHNAKQILDYTHAKQNMNAVKKIIADALKLTDKEGKKLAKQIRELLWSGNIDGIAALVSDKLTGKRKAPKAAMKKINEYFGEHARFQYQTFRDNGLPTGSGTIESAIRRVINLRVKGSGLFWGREHAENIIFLRSLVLTGKLKSACQKGLGIVRNMFNNNTIESLPLAA